MLFSNIQRSNIASKSHSETDYKYLDSSARVEAECIRSVITEWFLRYPDDNRNDLAARFKSSDDLQHISASFELYLHELCLRLGYSVRVHPGTNADKGTSPDFLLTDGAGNKFYLEAVQVTDIDSKERGTNTRMNVLFDAINQLKSNDFFLCIAYDEIPDTSQPSKPIKDELNQWLNSLDADDVIQKSRADVSNLPEKEIKYGECILKFTASPRAPEKRGKPIERILATQMLPARQLRTWEEICKSLKTKGSHYGELDAPLVIAVNANVFGLDKIDVMDALFGQESFNRENMDTEPRMERLNNGFWRGERGIRYKRVSSILIGFDIKPWTFAVRELTLYGNPWAKKPISGKITTLSKAVPDDDKMSWIGGIAPKDILELPRSYPGMEEK